MRFLSLFVCFCFAFPLSLVGAESLDGILARMDRAAPSFKGMSADVVMVTFTAILNSQDSQSGTIKMQRTKSGDARAIMDFSSSPGQSKGQIIAFLGKIIRIYYPEANSYQEFDLGKNSKEINQYLLLGFGSSGKELAQSYSITLLGTEKVAGMTTSKLLLIPKDAKVLEKLTKVEVWIPVDGVSPVQQWFYEPSGNSRKTTYSNLNLSPSLPKVLDYKVPPQAKKQG